MFRSILVNSWPNGTYLVGTTGFTYVNGVIQKPGSSQACPQNFQRLLSQFRIVLSQDVTPHSYLSGFTERFVHFGKIFFTPVPEGLPIDIPEG
jgi:hypothetical protein